jgi:hypothetical protein
MIFNNICSDVYSYLNGGYGDTSYKDIDYLHDFAVFDRNCIHNNSNLFIRGLNLNTVTWGQWSVDQPGGDDVNSLYQVDPLFVDTVEYKLQAGSPCKGEGRDLLGAYGPIGGVVDMGCYATGVETIGIVGSEA